jgi:hypothetical protein
VADGGFSIPTILKLKRRGRGNARAPLDVGNGGGIGGTSLPLPPSMGGHPKAADGVAAPVRAVAAQAFCRTKEKRERASARPKGRSGPPEPLGLEGQVGRTGPKWVGRS